jgi:hypothetical protein
VLKYIHDVSFFLHSNSNAIYFHAPLTNWVCISFIAMLSRAVICQS